MSREQYVATDKATGVEITVTGEFPPHPDDRMRIARTTTLFTRLISTLLSKEQGDRRNGFRAVETQLELADALIRQDTDDVRRLVRETMESMGVTQDQLDDLARQLRDLGGLDEATADQISDALGFGPQPPHHSASGDEDPARVDEGPVIDLPPPFTDREEEPDAPFATDPHGPNDDDDEGDGSVTDVR